MARVTRVNKSMKDQTCGRCGVELPKGSAYQWAKPGFRSRTRLIRCLSCSFRPSELTTSLVSTAYAAQEDLQDAIDSWDGDDAQDLTDALEAAADGAQECYDAYDEANSAWEDNSGSENDDFVERRDAIEAWQDELRDVDFDDRPEDPELEDPGPQGDDEDDHDYEARVAEHTSAVEEYETEVADWIEACRDLAQTACDELSL
jgi:hypothetical protein